MSQELFKKAWELDLEGMKALIEKGDDIFSTNEYDESLLGMIVKRENAESCIVYLLNNGFDINSQDNPISRTALIIACSHSNPVNVSTLLREGADPNLVDENGSSALSYAISIRCLECIKLLLNYNVDINEIRRGRTPLMIAVGEHKEYLNQEIIDFLLENGADINKQSDYGTALWEAISYKNLDMVRFLIRKGAKIQGIKSVYNETTMDFAERVGDKEINNFLRSMIA